MKQNHDDPHVGTEDSTCPECGTEINGRPEVCPNCGHVLTETGSDSPESTRGSSLVAVDSPTSDDAGLDQPERALPDSPTLRILQEEARKRSGQGEHEQLGDNSANNETDGSDKPMKDKGRSTDRQKQPRKRAWGFLRVALAVFIGLAVFGAILSLSGYESDREAEDQALDQEASVGTSSDEASEVPDEEETEPKDLYMGESGFPNMPAILAACLDDRWIDDGHDLAEDLGVKDPQVFSPQRFAAYLPSGEYMGIDRYELDVSVVPTDERIESEHWYAPTSIFTMWMPISLDDSIPQGLSFVGDDIYVMDSSAPDRCGTYLGAYDQSTVSLVDDDYLACTNAPCFNGYDTADALVLLENLGFSRDSIDLIDTDYFRQNLSDAYFESARAIVQNPGSYVSNVWGYSYTALGSVTVDGNPMYFNVTGSWNANLNNNQKASTEALPCMWTYTLHPRVSVTFSEDERMVTSFQEAYDHPEYSYSERSHEQFPDVDTYEYGLLPY